MPRAGCRIRQAYRGDACNRRLRHLLPPSTSRKHVPVNDGATRRIGTRHEAAGRARGPSTMGSRRARRGRVRRRLRSAQRVAAQPGGRQGAMCCRRGVRSPARAWSPVSFSPQHDPMDDRLPMPMALARDDARPMWRAAPGSVFTRATRLRAFRACPVHLPSPQAPPRSQQHCGALWIMATRQ